MGLTESSTSSTSSSGGTRRAPLMRSQISSLWARMQRWAWETQTGLGARAGATWLRIGAHIHLGPTRPAGGRGWGRWGCGPIYRRDPPKIAARPVSPRPRAGPLATLVPVSNVHDPRHVRRHDIQRRTDGLWRVG